MDYRTIFSFITSFIIGVSLYLIFIPVFRRVKLGQRILEIGPSWHKSKEGTPTMGGLFFIIPIVLTMVVFTLLGVFDIKAYGLISALVLGLSFGAIGFIDDYVKLFKKQNKGLTANQKLILQFFVAGVYLWINNAYCNGTTEIIVPFISKPFDLGLFYYLPMLVIIVYLVNCANLTDGLDGLAGSVATIMGLFFLGLALYTKDNNALTVTTIILGGIMAFLVFNYYPAKIMMGDTGSMFIGGILVGLTVYFSAELLFPLICFIWLAEGISVILQVAVYKKTGKRIFKMSPIHHHFEMVGWSERKIGLVFSVITATLSGIAFFLYTTA